MNINKKAYNTVLIFLAEESPCTLVTNLVSKQSVLWIASHHNINFNESIKDIQFVDSDVDVHYVQLKFI